MTPADVLKLIKEKEAKFADLRFTDTIGKEHHVTIPTRLVDEGFFKDGKMFDGSSIAGWKGINESDMILMPDPATAVIDPFYEETTVNLRCDVIEPMTMQGYDRDPRSLAKRAEAYLKSSGIADSALFGPENEFFIFDDVKVNVAMNGCSYEVDSYEGAWNSGKAYEDNNKGHRPGVKGGYFPVPPVDSQQDIRTAMSLACEEMGLKFEVHHHEVATAGQGEINVAATTAAACTCISRCRRKARRCSPVTSTAAYRRPRSIISAASSSTPAPSTPSPMRAPTATSGWCRDSRRRSSSRIPPATARPLSAFPGFRTRKGAASRCGSRTRPQIPTLRSPPCCSRASTASRTRFIPAIPPTRISMILSPRRTRRSPPSVTRSTWRSTISIAIGAFSRRAVYSPTI